MLYTAIYVNSVILEAIISPSCADTVTLLLSLTYYTVCWCCISYSHLSHRVLVSVCASLTLTYHTVCWCLSVRLLLSLITLCAGVCLCVSYSHLLHRLLVSVCASLTLTYYTVCWCTSVHLLCTLTRNDYPIIHSMPPNAQSPSCL